ncbi:TPA: polysaccharide deacetylase family protein [Staphylococcus aureus]|nr:polysaccharide deacetylase family protein [Staphylococcus aureus]HCX9573759.1 polysaccharide deacetylase family protein [Staphylococcus aureus]
MHKKYLLLFFLLLSVALLYSCSKHNEKAQNKSVNPNEYAKHKSKVDEHWETYHGEVYHVFYHPLITGPKVAFTGDTHQAKGNNDWMITVSEFKKSLNALYKNNYIIVNPHDVYDLSSHHVKAKKIKLPKGKKPLIISIDDMNYYSYMRHHGYADRLVLDKNKHVVSETTDSKGHTTYSDDNDIVPILNKFVKEHPDFSLNGEKGVVALTGYEGVLGYRTNELTSKDYTKNKKAAEEVVRAMKRDGWSFASHSYGHINFEKTSLEGIQRDTKRWKDEVEPIVGKTDMFVFPHGAQDRHTSAYDYLVDKAGFKFIAGVGPNNFTDISATNVYQDRVAIDGLNLFEFKYKLKPFFNPENVYSKQDRQFFKGNRDYEE